MAVYVGDFGIDGGDVERPAGGEVDGVELGFEESGGIRL